MARPHHRTQWAAQFAVASELCKRSYQVALTLGNHPIVDIMVISPNGKKFNIDVKGVYTSKQFFPVRPHPPIKDLWYVLAFVPLVQRGEAGRPNQFFVMSQAQINKAISANHKRYRERHGLPDDSENRFPGVEWKLAARHSEKWDDLPA